MIYPKDLGPILIWADLFPGARVVEAGVGAGALSMALLRAIGDDGQLDFLRAARRFRRDWRRKTSRATSARRPTGRSSSAMSPADARRNRHRSRDSRSARAVACHRARLARLAARAAFLLCYLPTVLQVKNLVDALRDDKRFACIETSGEPDALLALQRHERPSAAPHGRPHRLSHLSAPLADGQKDIPRAP